MLQMMTFPDWTPNAATPCLINEDDGIKRAIKVLDHIPVVDLHKIGVVYVGETQQEQNEILSNISGSRSYHHFLQNLGELVRLRDCKDVYTGGLDTMNDIDGKVALWWGDHDSSQMIFHVTTMMPNNDKERTGKKRHIGNNYVLVVWNESGLDKDSGNGGWKFDTIPAQFNFINIIISPIGSVQMLADSGGSSNNTGSITASSYYKVYVQRRPDIPDTIGGGAWSGVGLNLDDRPRILSESALPSFIRQLCIHANIFAQVFQAAQSSTGFSSNAKERLRQMKRIRTRASSTISTAAAAPTGGSNNNNNSAIDFSRYS